MRKIIIDTDIGFDLDDTWAILFALRCKDFDVKLISISDGDIDYKFRLTAKLLELCQRTDVPIALGKGHGELLYPQLPFIEQYNVDEYKGKVYSNYVEAYTEVLKDGPCDIVALSSMTSLQDVIDIISKNNCTIYSMMGSIKMGHAGSPIAIAEYNVVNNVPASQKVFDNAREFVMFPLDCCGQNVMRGESYNKIYNGKGEICRAIMQNYRLWYDFYPYAKEQFCFEESSGVLFDLAPLWYLLWPNAYKIENLKIRVNDEGFTVVNNQNGKPVWVATKVLDLEFLMKETANILCD